MKVAARIWSGIAVVVVAYVATVAIGAWFAQRTIHQLDATKEQAFPATLQAAAAVGDLNRQLTANQDAVTSGEPDLLKTATQLSDGVVAGLHQIAGGTWLSPERQGQITGLAEELQSAQAEALPVYTKLAKNESSPELQTQAGKLTERLKALATRLETLSNTIRSDAEDVLNRTAISTKQQRNVSIALLVGALVVSFIVVSLIIRRSVIAPLNRLNAALQEIAAGKGDLTGRLPVKTDRKGAPDNDELTQLAVSFNQFLGNLQRIIQLVAESTQRVAKASTEVDAMAKQVSADAGSSLRDARETNAAADAVSGDMKQVTTAVRDMVSSIREISNNSQQAARIASEAVQAASVANQTMDRLAASGKDIGEVVKLINRVSAQTNLLAINATIEAASAGEAGRGFSVVANEVKELAMRTAEAITTIQSRVQAIQTDTQGAAESLKHIGTVIGEINTTSTSIAGAVEEQTATTQAMDQTVSSAAHRTEAIKSGVDAVTRTAEGTTVVAGRTEAAARDLAQAAEELGRLIGAFKY
jgi:methyl-accepting chemotaxis protein